MSDPVSLLVFAGSLREGSYNKKLARHGAEVAREAGAQVTLADLRDFPMPLYDQDLEDREGLPAEAKEFKQLLMRHDAFLIASPEYNSSLPAVLKNAIDWASRYEESDERSLAAFHGKTAGLMAASPGRLGGLRVLVHLRAILMNIGVMVVPAQVTVAKADEAFDESGKLTNEYYRKEVAGLVTRLIEIASAVKAAKS